MAFDQILEAFNTVANEWKDRLNSHDALRPLDPPQEQDRAKLLAAARDLVSVLENPHSRMLEIAKGPAGHAALETTLKLKVFDGWARDEIMNTEELARKSGAEELLITRIMRVLVGIGIVTEQGENVFGHSPLSQTLTDPDFATLILGMSSHASLAMHKLPEYLANTNYRNPSDAEDTLFHYALGTRLNMFQWLETKSGQLEVFSSYFAVGAKLQGRGLPDIISSLFPNKEQDPLAAQRYLDNEHVLLVDVGAGRGQALREVRTKRPDLCGRMIAQDLPEVIAGREKVEGIENMACDFFQLQPIKGASVYLFCHIFHDWSDNACRQILYNTIPALVAGTSRIVILDQIIPNTNVTAFSGLSDLTMMTFSGMERTERQWRQLLEGVGLSVVNMQQPKEGSLSRDGVITAVLKG